MQTQMMPVATSTTARPERAGTAAKNVNNSGAGDTATAGAQAFSDVLAQDTSEAMPVDQEGTIRPHVSASLGGGEGQVGGEQAELDSGAEHNDEASSDALDGLGHPTSDESLSVVETETQALATGQNGLGGAAATAEQSLTGERQAAAGLKSRQPHLWSPAAPEPMPDQTSAHFDRVGADPVNRDALGKAPLAGLGRNDRLGSKSDISANPTEPARVAESDSARTLGLMSKPVGRAERVTDVPSEWLSKGFGFTSRALSQGPARDSVNGQILASRTDERGKSDRDLHQSTVAALTASSDVRAIAGATETSKRAPAAKGASIGYDSGSQIALANSLVADPGAITFDDSLNAKITRELDAHFRDMSQGFAPPGANHVIRADAARLPFGQIAEQIVRNRDKSIEIALSPKELGSVRMQLSTGDGTLTVMVTAERTETIDLMRRHIETLMQEFRRLGFEQAGFEFRQQGQGTHGQEPARSRTAPTPAPPSHLDSTPPAVPAGARSSLATGLDLRV